MSQIRKLKHRKTGVILEYKNGAYYVDGTIVPTWYAKLHLNVNTKFNVIQKDEWYELPTFEINYVNENGCICGHNGQTYNSKKSTIHQITVYLNDGEETIFKIGDYVTNGNGTPMKGKIVKIDLGHGVPYITTDWSNFAMVAWGCFHILPPETKFDLVNLTPTEKLTLYRELKKYFPYE